jgi:uncharacterized protein
MTTSDRAVPRTPWLTVLTVVVVAVAVVAVVGRDGGTVARAVRVLAVVAVAALAVLTARRGPGPAAVVRLGAGVVGTAIGVGIGVRWWSDVGASVVSLTALAALLVGVPALFSGVIGVARTVPGRPRWLVRGSVGAVTVVGSMVVVHGVAVAVAATNVAPAGGRSREAQLLDGEPLRMRTGDGVELAGWYLPSANGAAVVLVPGAGSDSGSVVRHASVLSSAGYGVLAVDPRGRGGSGGRAMDFGWHGDDDVGAALDELLRRPEVDPGRIGAVGLSMGGEVVLGASAADGRIRAVVAEGATGRTAADRRWLAGEYGARGWVQNRIDDLTYGLVDLFSEASPPVALADAAARSDAPVLLVAAGDVPEESRSAEVIAAAAPGGVEVWEVPRGGHTGGLRTDPDGWRSRVVGFLDRYLAG